MVCITVESDLAAEAARQSTAIARVMTVAEAHEEYFFEFQLAHELPMVDLTRTTARALLPPALYARFVGFARAKHQQLSLLARIWSVLYLGILFPPSPVVRACITYLLFISVIPIVFIVGLVSLDVVEALVKTSYEYAFLSLINTIHWLNIAFVFSDVRSFMCITTWCSLQTMLMLDANFRTFTAATKTVGAAIPGMILLGTLCAMRYIADGNSFTVTFGYIVVNSEDVAAFTSSTLVIFMIKITARKRLSKSGRSSLDSMTVHCAMLKARLQLAPRRERPRRNERVAIPALRTALDTLSTNAKQPIKLHGFAGFIIDARRTLVPGLLTRVGRWSRVFYIALYEMGVIGVAATSAAWIALLGFQVDPDSWAVAAVSVIGAVFSAVFVILFVSLAQRDLLWTLVYTFDFNFSVYQAITLALCLADMSRWKPAVCLAALSWWLWFQWVLLLDAVTPAARKRLGFTKKLAAPAMVIVLLGAVLLAVRIICSDSSLDPTEDDTSILGLLRNRRLIHWQPTTSHEFDLRIFNFSLQRIVTIVCWSSRLAVALVTGGEHELLFVRGFTRYATAFKTFPTTATTTTLARPQRKTVAMVRRSRVRPTSASRSQAPLALPRFMKD